MAHPKTAVALKVGERYYVRTSPKGRILTAWCLAGATLFTDISCSKLDKAWREIIRIRGRSPKMVFVEADL